MTSPSSFLTSCHFLSDILHWNCLPSFHYPHEGHPEEICVTSFRPPALLPCRSPLRARPQIELPAAWPLHLRCCESRVLREMRCEGLLENKNDQMSKVTSSSSASSGSFLDFFHQRKERNWRQLLRPWVEKLETIKEDVCNVAAPTPIL